MGKDIFRITIPLNSKTAEKVIKKLKRTKMYHLCVIIRYQIMK